MVLVLARWIHFSALYILFGSSFFWVHLSQDVWHGAALRLSTTSVRCAAVNAVAASVAALSGLAWLITSIAYMTGDFASLVDPATLRAFFFETSFGPLAIVRVTFFFALLATVGIKIPGKWRVLMLLTLSGLLLISQAWLGHAAEESGTLYGASMISAYIVHVLAGSAWLGGLVPLILAVAEGTAGPMQRDLSDTLRLLTRYSGMAIVAAGAVVLSGVANSAFRIGVPTVDMAASPYVTILVAKVALVSGMLACAGVTRFVLMPRLDRAQLGPLRRCLIASLCAEAGFGLLALCAAALLGVTPPPN